MASPCARLVLGLSALLLACGSGEDPAAPTAADTTASSVAPASAVELPRSRIAPQQRAHNAPPRIVAVRFEPERPTGGASVRVVADVEDPDGDSVWLDHVWWLDGEIVEGADTARLMLRDAPKGAALEVELVARDGKDASDPWRERSEVYNAIPELGLVRVEPEVVIAGDQPIVVRPEASDADGDPITFAYTWKVNGRKVDETSAALPTRTLRRGDRVEVSVRASDGVDTSEERTLPELRVANAAPRILSTPGQPAPTGGPFYQILAEDPDGDPALQYALEQAPEGMTVDPRTGAIDWQPTADQVGTHKVAVVVSDLQGGRSRQTIEVTVGEVGAAAQPPARGR